METGAISVADLFRLNAVSWLEEPVVETGVVSVSALFRVDVVVVSCCISHPLGFYQGANFASLEVDAI